MSIKYFSVLSGSLFASLIVLTSCLPSEDSLTTGKTATGINGSWSTSSCENQESDGYYKEKTTFNTSTGIVSFSDVFYSDANCLIIIEEYTQATLWFTLGETIKTDSGLTAREINIFETEEMLTPFVYSIYRVDGDVLYIGVQTEVEYTGTTKDRHTSLDFEHPATRI
jgi:hypothetical protein